MKLNPPKKITFWVTVALAVLGIAVYIVHLFARGVPYLQPIAFLLVVVAFIVLCLSLIVKNL